MFQNFNEYPENIFMTIQEIHWIMIIIKTKSNYQMTLKPKIGKFNLQYEGIIWNRKLLKLSQSSSNVGSFAKLTRLGLRALNILKARKHFVSTTPTTSWKSALPNASTTKKERHIVIPYQMYNVQGICKRDCGFLSRSGCGAWSAHMYRKNARCIDVKHASSLNQGK